MNGSTSHRAGNVQTVRNVPSAPRALARSAATGVTFTVLASGIRTFLLAAPHGDVPPWCRLSLHATCAVIVGALAFQVLHNGLLGSIRRWHAWGYWGMVLVVFVRITPLFHANLPDGRRTLWRLATLSQSLDLALLLSAFALIHSALAYARLAREPHRATRFLYAFALVPAMTDIHLVLLPSWSTAMVFHFAVTVMAVQALYL